MRSNRGARLGCFVFKNLFGLIVVSVAGSTGAAAQEMRVAHGDTLKLTVKEAQQLAARSHPAVLAARARVEQSAARVTQSRASLLPQVTASAADGRHTLNTASFGLEFPTAPGESPLFDPDGEVIGPIRTVDVRTHMSQTLFDWSSVERTRGARATAEAVSAEAGAVVSEAASAAASSYVRTLHAQARLTAREADIRLAQELVTIAENQLTAGVGVALDVTRARARLAALQAQLIADRSQVSHARLALADALGAEAETPIVLTDSLPGGASATVDADAAVARALSSRADVRALDERRRAADLGIRATTSERYPSLRLVADEGYLGKSWSTLLNTYSWGMQVSVPVFQGYGLSARRQEQVSVLHEIDALRLDLRRRVERQVRDALLDQRSAREQVIAARASLDLAAQQVDQARERFTTGVAGNADLVEASLVLSGARTLYVDALAAAALADVALTRAQGTFNPNELENPDER